MSATLTRPPYRTIEVQPVTGTIGAVVGGVDARSAVEPEQAAELNDALARHLVLFLRDQDLTEEQHLAFTSVFGRPVAGSIDTRPGTRPSLVLHLEDTAQSPPKADRWHTDVPFVATPPDVAVLCMLDTPPVGGDTMWVDLFAVYESLSPVLQRALADLELELGLGASADTIRELYGQEYYEQVVVPFRPVRHPLVRVHPVSGRAALWLCGSFMNGIAGMHPDESATLLRFLAAKLDDPNRSVRWRWRPGDVAVWDERCTNHRALADHYPQHRLVRRTLAGAGVPVGLTAASHDAPGEARA